MAQKWAYLDVAISKSKGKWIVDGKTMEEPDLTRATILNQYGAEGWELVSVTNWQGSTGNGHTDYFKRPLES